jgi:hypothetical protein
MCHTYMCSCLGAEALQDKKTLSNQVASEPHHYKSRTAQMENEELRMGQAILASEVQSLRRDLGSLAARLQVCSRLLTVTSKSVVCASWR